MIKTLNNTKNRLHGLDHLRVLAIVMVMIFHYGRDIPEYLEPIKKIAWSGVDLFFVLSGYLIGYQLLKEYSDHSKIDFKQFYVKRFIRIMPAYIAVLIVYFSLGSLKEGSGLPPLWRFLSFTQNFGLDTITQKSFSHAWSLCVEEQFYLLLPITIILVFRTRMQKVAPYLMLALIALGVLIRMYNWNEYVQPFIESGNRRLMVYGLLEKVYYPSHNRMDGLIVGVLIASIFNFKPKLKYYLSKHANLVLLFGIILFLLAYQVCDSLISYNCMIYGLPLISIAYGVILIGAISPTCIIYKLKSRITYIIAILSYAIYLTHKQVYHLVKMALKEVEIEFLNNNEFWVCFALALISGLILHVLAEKPFMKLRNPCIMYLDKLKNTTK